MGDDDALGIPGNHLLDRRLQLRFLLGKGLAFSKHSGVHAAFGTHFAKTGVVPPEFHRYLIRSMEVRHAGDYDNVQAVTAEEAAEQITRAEQFLALAFQLIGPIPPEDKQPD